jgi:capsular polysaccharide transport system ATP-binding protein
MSLELIDVHKSYPMRGGRKVIVAGANGRIERGEKLGILGRNGSGKSTLVRMIAGVEAPNKGRIRTSMSISWPIGSGAGIKPTLTGEENARFIARIYGKNEDRIAKFVDSFAELEEYFLMPVMTYSSGMRSRLSLSISLAVDFDCFLVDEALAVGDTRFGRAFEERIQRSGLILISHSPALVRRLCTRAAILDQGILTFYDDLDEALATYNAL